MSRKRRLRRIVLAVGLVVVASPLTSACSGGGNCVIAGVAYCSPQG